MKRKSLLRKIGTSFFCFENMITLLILKSGY